MICWYTQKKYPPEVNYFCRVEYTTHAAIWLPPEGDVDDPLEGGPENHAHFGLVLFWSSKGIPYPLEGHAVFVSREKYARTGITKKRL